MAHLISGAAARAARAFSTSAIKPLVTLVPVPRDYQQSSASAPFDHSAGSGIMAYCRHADRINTEGPVIIDSIEIGGGAIGWQMLAMNGQNPIEALRNYLRATPHGTPPVSLGRGQAGFALHDLHDRTLEQQYEYLSRTVTQTDAQHNPDVKDREFRLRFFHHNNNGFQKAGTEAAQSSLRKKGVTNFRIVDSTVYTDVMPLDYIAENVVSAMERDLIRNGPEYGTMVEVKDFAGSMTSEKARALQRLIAEKRDEKIRQYQESGQPVFAKALQDAPVGFHIHRTHFSADAGRVLVEGAGEFKLPTVIHCISKVRNASHLPIEDLVRPMNDILGIGITPKQEQTFVEMHKTLEMATKAHAPLIVMPGNDACLPPVGDHLAGGGLPSRIKYAAEIAKKMSISPIAAQKLLEDQLHKFRTENSIALVTPALKNMTDLAYKVVLTRAYNEENKHKEGFVPLGDYSGNIPANSVDTIRNLDPEKVTDKALLEACYKQHRNLVLQQLLDKEQISKSAVDQIKKIGLDDKKTSLDKEATVKILQAEGVAPAVQQLIVESCMGLTKPHKGPDETIEAAKIVAKLKKDGALAIPEADAAVILSTLGESGIGPRLVLHHGKPAFLPPQPADFFNPETGVFDSSAYKAAEEKSKDPAIEAQQHTAIDLYFSPKQAEVTEAERVSRMLADSTFISRLGTERISGHGCCEALDAGLHPVESSFADKEAKRKEDRVRVVA